MYLAKQLSFFVSVSLLHRDAVEKLFPDAIRMRFEDIQQNNDIVQSLAAFQKFGNDQTPSAPHTGRGNQHRGGGFYSGVLTALTGVAVSGCPTVFTEVSSVEILLSDRTW